MSDAELGFAVDELDGGGFVLVDTEMDCDVDPDTGERRAIVAPYARRDAAVDAYERARREVRRDRRFGA